MINLCFWKIKSIGNYELVLIRKQNKRLNFGGKSIKEDVLQPVCLFSYEDNLSRFWLR